MSALAKRRVGGGLVLIAVLLGLYGVEDALNIWAAVAMGLLALAAVWRRAWTRAALVVLQALGAVLIGFLALVGVDVLLSLLRHIPFLHGAPKLPILAGLALAGLVFGLAASWYLHRVGWSRYWSTIAAYELAFLVIVATPYVVGRITAHTDPVHPPRSVASERADSELDVFIVGDGRPRATPPVLSANPALAKFDVHYFVGFAQGSRVRWTLVEGGNAEEALDVLAAGRKHSAVDTSPTPRAGADSVLLLMVDGTPPFVADPSALRDVRSQPGEIERWRRLVANAVTPRPPAFALLQTTDPTRLRRWRHFGGPEAAVSFQALESQTATDAAVRLAVAAPESQVEFALALRYRPVLLFDKNESVPWPMSIPALFNEERVHLCHDQSIARTDCDSAPITDPEELVSGGTHLRLTLRDSDELRPLAKRALVEQEAETAIEVGTSGPGAPPEGTPPPTTATRPSEDTPPGAGSAIYVHPVPVEHGGRDLLYLDYWWFLPDNPVGVGGGALCGAGLVIAEVTCPNHQSDWEGMTVVVDRTDEPEIVAVQYAQHASVVYYSWQLLRNKWDGNSNIEDRVEKVKGWQTRPLAFSAEGTHATYPTPCSHCKQVIDGDLGEDPHRGNIRWVGDNTATCGNSPCLQLLPTRLHGTQPALWDDFEGSWGDRHCVFTYYCDSGTPPKSPGHQGRYEDPADYDGFVGRDWEYHRGAVPSARAASAS